MSVPDLESLEAYLMDRVNHPAVRGGELALELLTAVRMASGIRNHADESELRRAAEACDVVMDTAAQHGLGDILPPAYRDSWAMAHKRLRAALATAPPAEPKGTNP